MCQVYYIIIKLKGYTNRLSALGLFVQIGHSKVCAKRPQANIFPVQSRASCYYKPEL